MPAPRCPSIHKPPEEWVAWTYKYLEYKPLGTIMYPTYERFTQFKLVQHLGDFEIDRTWKYYLYLLLTGRKHRTLRSYL